ncbi:MAG: ATP-binding protein [Endomicrobia bacterium]|nr:ATP-binding protein [Endomicrobiia bacterium]MCL2506942.1 ATP-binding protein [Endomicrobiia bacterium]
MLANWDRSDAIKYFVLFCCSLILWLLGFSMMYFSANPDIAFFWARVGFLGVTFIPVLALMFVYAQVGTKKIKSSIWYFVAFAVVCLIINWSTTLIYNGVKLHFWGYYPIAGKLYIIFLLMFVVLFSMCSFILFKSAFNYSLPAAQRRQIVYVFTAFTICLLGVVDYIAKYEGIELYPFGYILIVFFITLISFAIIKYNLLDVELVLARTGLYLLLYTILFGIPVLIGVKTGNWKLATFIAVIFASIGTMVFNGIQKKTENLMLAEQRSYQNILLQAAAGMMQRHDLKKLLKIVVHLVKRSVKIKFAAIYLLDDDAKEYRIVSFRADDRQHIFKNAPPVFSDSPFVEFTKSKEMPFVYEEIPEAVKKKIHFDFRIGLIVPTFALKEVNGFLLLGEKNNHKPYSKDDINIFNILASQTAMAIENCMFIEEFKKAQEKVFSAEKLASIGGLAEGVAHQINNRLNHFSVIAGEMYYELEEFKNKMTPLVSDQKTFSESIKYFYDLSHSLSDNVKRTSAIIKGILNYARVEASETQYKEFELKEVVELSIDLLKVKHHIKAESLVDYSSVGNKTIFGIKSLIMESVYNLVDNGYEATLEMKDYVSKHNPSIKYNPKITIILNDNPDSSEIIVADNGIGIKPENFKKTFAPFFTTKSSYKSGSGIGMYVVKRMIEEMHKGSIWIESEYLQGTKIYINLPKPS